MDLWDSKLGKGVRLIFEWYHLSWLRQRNSECFGIRWPVFIWKQVSDTSTVTRMNRLAGFPSYWRFVDLINQQIALLMNIFWPKSHACCMSVVLLGILFFGSQIGWICAVSTCNPCPRSPDENPEFSTSSSHSKAISKCWSHLFVSQLSLSKFHELQIIISQEFGRK